MRKVKRPIYTAIWARRAAKNEKRSYYHICGTDYRDFRALSDLVTRFGEPVRQYQGPRKDMALPYFKWPFPIEQIHKFDSRMRVFSVEVEETRTASGDPIIVETYVIWRISEPLKFFNSIKTVKNFRGSDIRQTT